MGRNKQHWGERERDKKEGEKEQKKGGGGFHLSIIHQILDNLSIFEGQSNIRAVATVTTN